MYKKDLNFIIDIIKDKSTKHTVNDWYSLLGFIETNKLSGYILNKLKRKKLEIPKLIYSSLYNTYSLQKVRNNVLRKFINKISYELEINNINHAFLKGSILSNCSFDNKTPIYKLGERTSNDIDILINPKDLGKLEKILEKLHFKQGYYDYFKEKVILFDRKEIISRRMNRNETAPWVLKTTNTIVPFIEIDINFSTSNLSNDNKLTDKLLSNTVCYKSIDNNYIRTLEKYDFIIHLILHAYKELTNKFQVDRHKDIQLYKFLDLYLLLSKDIDLNELLKLVKEYHVEYETFVIFYKLYEIFDLSSFMSFCFSFDYESLPLIIQDFENKELFVFKDTINERLLHFDNRKSLIKYNDEFTRQSKHYLR